MSDVALPPNLISFIVTSNQFYPHLQLMVPLQSTISRTDLRPAWLQCRYRRVEVNMTFQTLQASKHHEICHFTTKCSMVKTSWKTYILDKALIRSASLHLAHSFTNYTHTSYHEPLFCAVPNNFQSQRTQHPCSLRPIVLCLTSRLGICITKYIDTG